MKKSKKSTQTLSKKDVTILGIDPGFGRLGIAILNSKNNKPNLIHSECFETDKDTDHPERLALIHKKIVTIIKKYKPQKLAIESLIFAKNEKTALKVAEVRGIIIALAKINSLSIEEYHPNTIKISVTGYGKSDKSQIIYMIHKIIGIDKKFEYDDEYDAIAVALTCDAHKNIH